MLEGGRGRPALRQPEADDASHHPPRTGQRHGGGHAGIEALTETERKVLRLIAEFKTTKEIAGALSISPRTVDRHRSNIAEKLGLSGSHALTKFAVNHGSGYTINV